MSLPTFWFIVIGVLWTGYLVLEGFDFGVGALLPVLGRGTDPADSEKRRRVLLNTIGPFWDGNEVWLLTAGGAMFAAFPLWYATMFSGFYLALLLLLVGLIVRNVGFEYRHKRDSVEWRRRWDRAIVAGSVAAPVLVGTALTNLLRGVPINADHDFTGSLLSLLNPLSLLGGIAILALCLTHGAHFVALKTDGAIRQDARALAFRLGLAAATLGTILLVWVGIGHGGSVWSWVTTAIAATALLASVALNRKGSEGWAFIGTTVTIAMAVATDFIVLFPNLIVSSTTSANNVTTANAASSHLTLQIMTGAALAFTPVMLAYTAWNYWVFRKRITTAHIPDAVPVH